MHIVIAFERTTVKMEPRLWGTPWFYWPCTKCSIACAPDGAIFSEISLRSRKDKQDSASGRLAALQRTLKTIRAKRSLRTVIYSSYWSMEKTKGQKKYIEIEITPELIVGSLLEQAG